MSTKKDPTGKDDGAGSQITPKDPSPPPTRQRSKNLRFHSPPEIPSPPPGPSAPEPEKPELATPKSILKPSKSLISRSSESPELSTEEMIRLLAGPESAIIENPLMSELLGDAPIIQSANAPKFLRIWQAGDTMYFKIKVADVLAVRPGQCDLPPTVWNDLLARAHAEMAGQGNSSAAGEKVLKGCYQLD